eukprot:1161189-Pelagomonas_calceolata.AAC.14
MTSHACTLQLVLLLRHLDAQSLDEEGEEGELSDEEVTNAIKETGVFLSSADLAALLPKAPRAANGAIKYMELSDLLLGQSQIQGA